MVICPVVAYGLQYVAEDIGHILTDNVFKVAEVI